MNKKTLEIIELLKTVGGHEEHISYLKSLEDDSYKLSFLENGGVDNWGGYEDALEDYWDENKGEEE